MGSSDRQRSSGSRRVIRPRTAPVHVGHAPNQFSLLYGSDCGSPIVVDPAPYIFASREPGWGPHIDGFLARNRSAIQALGLEPRIVSGRDGVRLELQPGLNAGAIPLRSAVTGKVAGGIVVSPRFGWTGVGRVLAVTGWGTGPEFLDQPFVPGSGREVPPWILAGPVLRRLGDLLAHLRIGYVERDELRTSPRGRIQWSKYLTKQIPSGRWHQLPCQYSELDLDPRLRQAIRWTLERLHRSLGEVGGGDPIARPLIDQVVRLIALVSDVPARQPLRGELDRELSKGTVLSNALREGLRAMGWIVDERGLGGGRASEGLSWMLPLAALWERYVESLLRSKAYLTGGQVRVGRAGETIVPLSWNDSSRKALGHLVPDFVIYRSDEIEIVDAKYKSHFADLDSHHWSTLAEETQDAMRADVHQVLAYAAIAGSSEKIRATLIYPVGKDLYRELAEHNRTTSEAVVPVGSRTVTLCIRAASFGK